MVYFPLLSNAYGAALFSARATMLESEPRHRLPATACSAPAPQGPFPAPDDQELEETLRVPVDRDARPAATATPNDDDMETARTRPFRLDQIHL